MPDERGKAPAFQFYPKDFLSDEKQLSMSLAEAGAYIRLISVCWLDGSLPNEPKRLARLCGATSRQIAEMWPAIGRCFQVAQDGRLIHPRLEIERLKQATFRQRQSDKGKASAASRSATERQPNVNRGSTGPQPIEPKSNSPISYLQSPISEKKVLIPLPLDLDVKWAEFQQTYPANRRSGGGLAFDFFRQACESVGYPVLIGALRRHCQSEDWRKGYAPGMLKWLENQLWIQDPDLASEQADASRKIADEHLAKLDAERAARRG